MKKLFVSYILGVLSFVMAMGGVFSFIFSIPGLVLAIVSLKDKPRVVTLPIGYRGSVGKKKVTARPFMTTRYLSFIAIGLNVFSMAVALFVTFTIFALLSVGSVDTDKGQVGVSKVMALSEVREFKKAVEDGGRSKFEIAVDRSPSRDEPFYTIQVFEVFPDHRTTFAWFRYDLATGGVLRQNIVEDRWEIAK